MKRFFKLTRRKRVSILIATLIATLLAIIFGTVFYVAKNGKRSIEYGGGAEYVVQISTNSNNAQEIANDVAQSIYQRVDPLGIVGATAEAEISNDSGQVRVTYPGHTSDSERKEIENLITAKPQLILTDIYGNPLFNESGYFRYDDLVIQFSGGDPNGFVEYVNDDGVFSNADEFYDFDLTSDKTQTLGSKVPILSGGSKVVLKSDGTRVVQINLEEQKKDQWTYATSYISSLPEGKKVVLAWLDPHKFLAKMKDFGNNMDYDYWGKSNGSIYNLAHVGENPENILRENVIDAKSYLISVALTEKALSGSSFIIEGGFTPSQAQLLSQQINYGVSDYQLKVISSNIIDPVYGDSAFQGAIIAGAIVLGLIALILMYNYGLLGFLATISISLFVFLTLTAFTAMNAQYSPASIAALVIGIGMSVDAVIIMFERLKNELYRGTNLKSATKISQKKSWVTIFDANITTLIVAIVLFYFGTRSIIGLSITFILSIIFTLVIMLFFTQFIASQLIKSNIIKNNNWLVGLKPKLDPLMQKKVNKINFVKNTKWFTLSSGIILIVGITVFIVFAVLGNSLSNGFVLSQEFAGGTSITMQLKPGYSSLDLTAAEKIFKEYNIPLGDIITKNNDLIQVRTLVQFDDVTRLKTALESQFANANVLVANTSIEVAKQLVNDALLALTIAIAIIIVYALIRFKWTYAIAAIIALIHDILIVLSIFVIARIEIEPLFIAALLSVVGYSINDTIVTFDRIREKMALEKGDLKKAQIKKVANSAIQETFKRSIWTSATTLLAIIVLMSFGEATKLSFNIAMFVGLISGTYSSIFIATWVWIHLEVYRQKRIFLREKNNFWKTSGVEEQTVKGINDFKV